MSTNKSTRIYLPRNRKRRHWEAASSPRSKAAPDQSSADLPDAVVDGNSKMDLYDGFWMIINGSWISQIQVRVLLKCVKPISYKCLIFCSVEDYTNNICGKCRRFLPSVGVYGNRGVDHDEPHYASFPKLLADQNIINPQIIKEKMTIAFLTLSFPDLHVIVQFWSFVIDQNRCLLTTLDQPCTLVVGWLIGEAL